jgi:hypothetical protein
VCRNPVTGRRRFFDAFGVDFLEILQVIFLSVLGFVALLACSVSRYVIFIKLALAVCF